jgi:hypothetical protein
MNLGKFGRSVILAMLIIAALFFGKVLATFSAGFLPIMAKAATFGFTPSTFEVVGNSLTFGLQFNISLAQFLTMLLAIFIYPKVIKAFG